MRARGRRRPVGRQQQLHRQRRVVEASGGVDARRQAETDGVGADGVGRAAADLEQGAEAGARRTAQAPQTHGHQRAILVEQRHHVGDGAHRRHVDVGPQTQRQLCARRAAGLDEQRVRQLEGHPDAGQRPVRVGAQVGGDHDALGQLGAELVVVGDDDVETEPGSPPHRVHVLDAAVDRDQQIGPALRSLLDGGLREPVALAETVRQQPADVGAQLAQHLAEQEGGRDAVGVVVAVHHDALPAPQGAVDARPRLCHPAQQVRVVEQAVGLEEGARRGGFDETAASQHLAEDTRHAELGREPERSR